ncbi:glycerophosphodiester phosphodiesterase family protein [Micromonospora sp. WMMD1128]|uniref:glycerophosphodiester phosphodiesterase family protein n=1 Tax=unclassified Micromonospora TaxID=2617518 RepID=UPI00248D086A|nr:MULTISPECIES: glycerophosphodiester phosphodiesterase family protein [unclassified Micromonospora]WBB76521.1 glycerophosphodiester phosphodiesterase family protein [Micromonospora sp. WMMD1128]WFE35696.1 glycerophosphodiester phosphodiesterase family protein [Micromonospora sp. WMMD975]
MQPRHGYLDAPAPLAFAHRGGAADGDENTAAAFARAVALGYRYVETDVHATADGVPVVFHDPTLRRVTGENGRIADLRFADLASVRVGGAAVVPRLDDVLGAWPQVRFNVDVKADGGVEPTVAAVERAGAGDRVLLASFSDARLTRLRALAGPTVATGLGMRGVARLRMASLHGRALRLPPSVVAAQVPVSYGRIPVVDRRLIAYCHRIGLQVHVWTIDEPTQMHHLLDLGVDGIMTDHVGVLRDVYRSRGHWAA